MTPDGEIAHPPPANRQKLNRRLQNGELAQQNLLSWLNQFPEVQSMKNRSTSVKPWASVRSTARTLPRQARSHPNPDTIEPN